MRTPDQLINLRKVFSRIYTPLAVFWPDEEVDFLAERLQDAIDKNSEWTWEIRIVTEDNFETNWSVIKPEPKTPRCNVYTLKKSCQGLLKRHPQIISILATAKEDPKLVLRFAS